MISEKSHNYLSCTDCKRQLADVVVTKPAEVEFEYICLCPCGGESPLVKVKGLVHIGSGEGVVISNRYIKDNKVVLQTKKEKT